MSDVCPACGKDRVLVGYAHNCVPRVFVGDPVVRHVTENSVTEKTVTNNPVTEIANSVTDNVGAPRKRGRPRKADSATAAERMKQMRARKRSAPVAP